MRKNSMAIDAGDYSKYETPIPSRDFIIDLLKKHNDYLHRGEIAKALNLFDKDTQEALRRRLRAMERDGQLEFCRDQGYSPIDERDLLQGRIVGHRDGFGFLSMEGDDDDLFVPPAQMRRVFDGDKVLVRITGVNKRGRKEIHVLKVIERNTSQITGYVVCENEQCFLRPSNDRIANTIELDENSLKGAQHGQIVVADITQYPSYRGYAQAEVSEVLGDDTAPGIEIDVVMRNYDIPHEWPQATLTEAGQWGDTVKSGDKVQRYDLRELPFVTIDGEDAKDFDDAVYCEPIKSGWRLFVAIADVSHYVKPGSPLDTTAQERGTSVYFPGQVIPMLPEALSNGLCSLNPNVDRLTMVCEMTINHSGKMTSYQFSEGIINSHARLTYTQVNAVLNDPDSRLCRQTLRRYHEDLEMNLLDLGDVYDVLFAARKKRGAIDFETTEVQFLLNDNRKIESIKPIVRNDAHKLIEECMLCANVATAKFLEKHKLSALYRVHDGPQPKKLEALRAFLKEKDLHLGGGNTPSPKHYDQLLSRIATRSDAQIIQTMLLRSLGQAEYSADNLGHFGLAYSAYAHFTSPIRRYPDLLVHRAIRSVIRRPQAPLRSRLKAMVGLADDVRRIAGAQPLAAATAYPYGSEDVEGLAGQCSLLSRRAEKASWDVEARLKCEYMHDRVGDTFKGLIATVTSFGLFVELNDTKIEGMVHISTLKKAHYQWDAAKQCLASDNGRRVYTLGDSVKVQVARVDREQGKIEFTLVE